MKEYYDEKNKCIGYVAETYEELVQLMTALQDLDDDDVYPVRCHGDLAVRYMQSIVDSIEE